MARRRKTSPLEDFLDLIVMLPWWGGVTLAIVAFGVLHPIAAREVVPPTDPAQMSGMLVSSIWKTMATLGQYVLPVLCLAGAGVSAMRRSKRQSLVVGVVQGNAAAVLDGMSWREFEMLVGEAYRLQGYTVTETGGGGADGGVDLVLAKGGEKSLVQCKQWRAFKVGVEVVRELYGVMAATGATGGFVVTSGSFTEQAISFAEGRNVKLVDGPKLFGLIQQAQASVEVSQVIRTGRQEPHAAEAQSGLTPSCPKCSSPMVKRHAKRGANAGSQFWGCPSYPDCKGIRQIE